MKKLPFFVLMVLAVASCAKKDPAAAGGSGSAAMAGSGSAAMAGSDTMAGSGSGSAMAGSAMAGSAMAGSDTMAGSGSAMAGSAAMAGSGSGSAVAMAGSGDGSAAWKFDKLTHEEQMDFMKKQVVPTMKPLFQKFDAKHYANFGCKTCHGKDPQKVKFKMPTPDLPKLDFAALENGKQKPEIAKWMGEVVKPEMAKLLKEPEFDPKKPEAGGFGCLECHQQKK